MLIVWNTQLLPSEQRILVRYDSHVVYWPASWMKGCGYSEAVPVEWWISFSVSSAGLMWCMHYPEHSRIVYSK